MDSGTITVELEEADVKISTLKDKEITLEKEILLSKEEEKKEKEEKEDEPKEVSIMETDDAIFVTSQPEGSSAMEEGGEFEKFSTVERQKEPRESTGAPRKRHRPSSPGIS